MTNGRWALLVIASGMLSIGASSGLLPPAMNFAFKPLTTLLIIAFAWPRGACAPRRRSFIRVGLLLSWVGDVALLWPKQGFLPGLVAFLLAHLAYIVAFCVPVRFAARPMPFLVYALVATLVLSQLWPGIPGALRIPVLAYVLCLATMAAQAAAWWQSRVRCGAADEAGAIEARSARFAAIGGVLFMASDSLLAINKFTTPLPLASLWILLTYWAAQWCIASSLVSLPAARRATSP